MNHWVAAVEILAAALLILSGLFALLSAIGFLRLPEFFLRMHPPALAYTLGSWCVALSAALYLSSMQGEVVLMPLLVPMFLAVTVPVTTLLLARVSLFRQRSTAPTDSEETSAGTNTRPGAAPRLP